MSTEIKGGGDLINLGFSFVVFFLVIAGSETHGVVFKVCAPDKVSNEMCRLFR